MSALLNAAGMCAWARELSDVWDDDGSGNHPAAVDPDGLLWRFDPAFPVARFDAAFGLTRDKAWVEFLASEVPADLRDSGTAEEKDSYLDRLRDAVRRGTVEPILAVEGKDRCFWPLDGFHRLGMAAREEIGTLPAYVGYQP